MVKVTMKSKKNGASSLFLVEDRTSSESTKKATEKKRGRTRVLQVKSPPKTKGATKPKAKPKKKAKKQDANMPKKPPTAFFYFLEDFRKEFQEQNPGVKSMRDIGKACGEKWKTMTYEQPWELKPQLTNRILIALPRYITYSKEEEAVRCIQSVHGFILEGRSLRACFGTTKYCHSWLRNVPCTNPDCPYLHDIGTQEDSFTKDEIISAYTRSRVQQITGATYNLQRRSGNVLPPPADDYCNSSASSSGKRTIKSAPSEKVQYYDIATEKRAEFEEAMQEYLKRKERGEDQESDTEDSDY